MDMRVTTEWRGFVRITGQCLRVLQSLVFSNALISLITQLSFFLCRQTPHIHYEVFFSPFIYHMIEWNNHKHIVCLLRDVMQCLVNFIQILRLCKSTTKEKSIKIKLDFSFLQSTRALLNDKQKRSKVHGRLWNFYGNNKIAMKCLSGKNSDTLVLSSPTSSKMIIWNDFLWNYMESDKGVFIVLW